MQKFCLQDAYLGHCRTSCVLPIFLPLSVFLLIWNVVAPKVGLSGMDVSLIDRSSWHRMNVLSKIIGPFLNGADERSILIKIRRVHDCTIRALDDRFFWNCCASKQRNVVQLTHRRARNWLGNMRPNELLEDWLNVQVCLLWSLWWISDIFRRSTTVLLSQMKEILLYLRVVWFLLSVAVEILVNLVLVSMMAEDVRV